LPAGLDLVAVAKGMRAGAIDVLVSMVRHVDGVVSDMVAASSSFWLRVESKDGTGETRSLGTRLKLEDKTNGYKTNQQNRVLEM